MPENYGKIYVGSREPGDHITTRGDSIEDLKLQKKEEEDWLCLEVWHISTDLRRVVSQSLPPTGGGKAVLGRYPDHREGIKTLRRRRSPSRSDVTD